MQINSLNKCKGGEGESRDYCTASLEQGKIELLSV